MSCNTTFSIAAFQALESIKVQAQGVISLLRADQLQAHDRKHALLCVSYCLQQKAPINVHGIQQIARMMQHGTGWQGGSALKRLDTKVLFALHTKSAQWL